jgi:hypothetical protein
LTPFHGQARASGEIFYIAEQEDGGNPAYVCSAMRREQCSPVWRAVMSTASASARGDIYAGLTTERSVDKFVRTG